MFRRNEKGEKIGFSLVCSLNLILLRLRLDYGGGGEVPSGELERVEVERVDFLPLLWLRVKHPNSILRFLYYIEVRDIFESSYNNMLSHDSCINPK